MAHRTLVHALHGELDGLVAFGEREEGRCAQSSEDVGLRESNAGFDLGLVAWLVKSRREDDDRVIGGHRAIGSVDLRVVIRGLVDPTLEIVGNQQLRRAAEDAEHAHVRAGLIRQSLSPRRLGIGEVGGAEHADKNLGLVNLAGRRIDDRNPPAGIVDERLLAGDVVLAHHRAQAALEAAQQIAESAVAVLVDLPIFLPWQMLRICQGIIIVTAGRFSSRASAAQSGSALRRWPVGAPARPNSRCSSASSVTSSASGHVSPAAAARFRLSWIVERAAPNRRPITHALTPPW